MPRKAVFAILNGTVIAIYGTNIQIIIKKFSFPDNICYICNRTNNLNSLNKRIIIIILAAICSLLGTAQKRERTPVQKGKASYYSKRFHGRRTASGERLHPDSLTCAHRNYPFGTLLKVKYLGNGREIVVKVNDRGPFKRGRVIDLSYRAAKELGMLAQGVGAVEVSVYHPEKGVPFQQDYELPELDFSTFDGWKPDANLNLNAEPLETKDKETVPERFIKKK